MTESSIIGPELDETEENLDKQDDDQDQSLDDELLKEQQEVSARVLESAQDLENLASERLYASLGGELSAAAANPASNTLEVINKTPASDSRYSVLRRQVALESKTAPAPAARVDLLRTLLGHDLTEGMKAVDARNSATTLLTHLAYAAKGAPLPELAASPAAQAVIDVGGQLSAMSDGAFWKLFADAHSGTVADPRDLQRQLAVMGMVHEFQPLKSSFTWPTGDAVTLQVDELVAAAMQDGGYVDLSEMYARAGELTMNGQPIPRAVMTELVRMAVADIINGNKWKAGSVRTPDMKTVEQLLGSEPADSQGATDRNSMRTSAKQLSERANGAVRTGDPTGRELATRASRGYLKESTEFLRSRLENGAIAMGRKGKAVADSLHQAVDASRVLDALDMWSESYRAGEADPVKLKLLLDNVNTCGKNLDAELTKRFPNVNINGTDPAQNALSFGKAMLTVYGEVAFEAAELLRPGGEVSTDPLAGPKTAANENTVRGDNRRAASKAINGEKGLLGFIDAAVPAELRADSWVGTLRKAASDLNLAESRDANQVAKAAGAFVDALSSAKADLEKNWTPGAVFLGEGVIDSLATALGDKLATLGAADPGIATATADALADLKGFQQVAPTISDPVDYWQTTLKSVKGMPSDTVDLPGKLKAWAAATAPPVDPATLSATTYAAVDALITNRIAVLGSKQADGDKAILVRTLDDLSTMIGATVASLSG